ncbi:hypothetical protein GCM10011452_33790 [Gemmobacter lanyuensis]|uniref:Uncharacterized protein n=2 Tax=Gemmobacter lanyuensis TaxID=1054497 RepID=A0A918J244_9RHOB|nr:hypothetical protein GCM10011452_33790 [Gemmobacter lanyuensis]
MIPWLRVFLVAIWVASIAGAALIFGLAMGFYSSTTFFWSGVAGLVIGLPAALANWVWLRPRRAGQAGWNGGLFRWLRDHSYWRRA